VAAQNKGAMLMQSVFRGLRDRKKAKGLKNVRALEKLKLMDLFTWGATMIQKTFRAFVRCPRRSRLHSARVSAAHLCTVRCALCVAVAVTVVVRPLQLARRRAKTLRQKFEKRWKEMWDHESGRPFYHDKNTGEIRWRRPQHLLNQLPKPVCNNCDEQFAAFECRVCVEFFCASCWPQVHFGGKRKQHEYRCVVAVFSLLAAPHTHARAHTQYTAVVASSLPPLHHRVWAYRAVCACRPLYDRYGLRVDYGEGEWPSVWPSEIQQDEYKGWTVVAAPVHQTPYVSVAAAVHAVA
jgi:hypothetical protein